MFRHSFSLIKRRIPWNWLFTMKKKNKTSKASTFWVPLFGSDWLKLVASLRPILRYSIISSWEHPRWILASGTRLTELCSTIGNPFSSGGWFRRQAGGSRVAIVDPRLRLLSSKAANLFNGENIIGIAENWKF